MDEVKAPTSATPAEQLFTPAGGVGAAPAETKGAEDKSKEVVVEAPAPRTYSEEEWNKRQSKLDAEATKERTKFDGKTKELQQLLEQSQQQLEEAQSQTFLRTLEEQGGNVDAGKTLLAREQAFRAAVKGFEATKVQQEELQEKLNVAGRAKFAHELMQTYKLEGDAEEALFKAENDGEMENIALKLHVENLKTEQRQPAKVDPGVTVTKGVNLDHLPPDILAGTLMEQEEAKNK